jgi:hypothetical protein
MAGNPFQVLGTRVAKRIGREREWNRLLSLVERNHLSLVGPKYIGKSVLLLSLAEHFQAGNGMFRTSAYWDLRHGTPNTDAEFFSQFAKLLLRPVRSINRDYAAELDDEPAEPFKKIKMVFELLNEENISILVCLDGCDDLLLGSAVTKNLWDNLRALAEMNSLRFVTASRGRLRDLCHSPDSKTSDFWNIFRNPVGLTAMTAADIDDCLRLFGDAGISVGPGAASELLNWSGGIPVVVAAHCHAIWETAVSERALSKDIVDGFGRDLHLSEQDAFREIWDDCSEEQRAFVSRVQLQQLQEAAAADRAVVTALTDRGFIRVEGRRIQIASRALGNFVSQGAGGRSNVLASLFGTDEGFRANAKGLLQLRFAALPVGVDDDLLNYLRNAIDNSDNANVLVRMIRALIERSFHLIWDRSIPDRKIPDEWAAEWKHPDRDGNAPMREPPQGAVPGRFGKQCQLLSLMTDPRRTRRTPVRRSTYVLIEGLHTVGDFGQHMEGEAAPHGFGIAVCLTALQLVDQLTRDIRREY